MSGTSDFSLETQWKKYLKMVDLREEHMPSRQTVELKRAFFGACGQMLVLFRDGVGTIKDENEAIKVMEGIEKECAEFWFLETERHETEHGL